MTVHRSWYHAKKHLGQNFLIDPNQLSRLVEALDLRAKDRVIEIGPGTGLLSERIQPLVRKLWAIEIDRDLAGQLQRTFSDADNVEIIQADILETDLIALCGTEAARVIGNIPYYITTPIIFHVLDHSGPIQDMTLLIQKEVGQRIVAEPNSKEYGILSVFSQAYARVELLRSVPAAVFRPKPRVDSCLVRWTFDKTAASRIKEDALFRRLVRTAFNQRRKMLRSTLKPFEMQKLSRWDLTRRPEDLAVDEWVQLANDLT